VFAVGSGIVAGALDGFVAAAEGSVVAELVVAVPVEPEGGEDPDAAVDAEPVTLLPPCVATEASEPLVEAAAVTCVGSPAAGALTGLVSPLDGAELADVALEAVELSAGAAGSSAPLGPRRPPRPRCSAVRGWNRVAARRGNRRGGRGRRVLELGAASIVPDAPVPAETCWVEPSTVDESVAPPAGLTSGVGDDPSAAADDAVSAGVDDVVAASPAENQPRPEPSLGVAAGAVGSAGSVVAGGVPAVGVVAAAGVASEAVAGSDTGEPTSSSTTGTVANGSFAFVVLFATGGACECTSATTGTRRAAVRATECLVAVVVATCCDAAAFRASEGSGAGACKVGCRNSGNVTVGVESDGSATDVAGTTGCRNAAAIGPM
jgi:hypothetical protein